MRVRCWVEAPDVDGTPSEFLISDGTRIWIARHDQVLELDTAARSIWIVLPPHTWCAEWLQPTKPTIRFRLFSDSQPEWPKIGQVTDLHICDSDRPFLAPQLGLEQLADRILDDDGVISGLASLAQRCDVLVITGDLTDHGVPSEFKRFQQIVRSIECRTLILPGNHDHYGALYVDPTVRNPNADVMTIAYPELYEETLGPRWWAQYYGNLLFVALDWFTYKLGIDSDVQDFWLQSLFEAVPDGTNIVFLSHDIFPRSFYSRLRRAWPALKIRGSLSGHWHVSRIVAADEILHINTAPAFFGGLDLSLPQSRIVRWNEHNAEIESLRFSAQRNIVPRFEDAPPAEAGAVIRWVADLPGNGHLGHVWSDHRRAIVASSSDDSPQGWISCIDSDTGSVSWQTPVPDHHRSGVAVADDTVLAVSITGTITALRLKSGGVLWQLPTGDPLQRFISSAAAYGDGRLFAGDLSEFVAVNIGDGSLLWSRTDLGRAENLLTYGACSYYDGRVVIPFGGPGAYLTVLDAQSGSTIWTYARDGSIPTSNPLRVSTGLLVAYSGGILRLHDFDTGSVLSEVRTGGAFPTLGAKALDGCVFVGLGDGRIGAYDQGTLSARWETPVGTIESGILPYHAGGLALSAAPSLLGNMVFAVGADGVLFGLDRAMGQKRFELDLGVAVTASPSVFGGDLYVQTVPGHVMAIRP